MKPISPEAKPAARTHIGEYFVEPLDVAVGHGREEERGHEQVPDALDVIAGRELEGARDGRHHVQLLVLALVLLPHHGHLPAEVPHHHLREVVGDERREEWKKGEEKK